jgi:hypothetical protein
MPWIGGLLALATIGVAIRRKGWLGGTIDTALNATPYVGAAKNAVEWARGRDLIRDRAPIVAHRFSGGTRSESDRGSR